MEEITSNMYRNVKGFWKRRGYTRLNVRTTHHRRRMTRADELGGGGDPTDPNRRQRRRFWKKIKIIPKIKLNKFSPKKLLIRLRDGYVNFMLRLASSSAVAGGGGFGAMDYGVAGFGMRPMKEYDEKVIVEIYKSLVMAQGNKLSVNDIGADSNNSLVVCAPQSK